MTLSLIVAMSANNVIGKNNQIPWHLSEDLKHFKALTMGHPIIMGRKNHESIGRVLPGRTNIIITREPGYQVPGAIVVDSPEKALKQTDLNDEIFIIGGAQIYAEYIEDVEKIYLTLIEKDIDGDVFFPEINWEEFSLVSKSEKVFSPENNFWYSYLLYERKRAG
ncbi:dihydrofolate reductase [bacterium]|nr:dihydrofolate reductase [bacterium]